MVRLRLLLGGLALTAFVAHSGLASSHAQAPASPQGPLPPALLECPDLAAALRTVANNDARLRDWPQIARYREANRAVTSAEVVFMGDSITDSWPQPRFGAFFSGKANIGPMTDEQIEGNLASMAELASANGIRVVLSSITPVSEYHVASPTAAPQTTLRPMTRVRALNDWMRQYAVAHRHGYLDYFSAMVDGKGLLRTELSGDDLHPNAAGYAIMAPLAEAAIQTALAMK